MRCGVLCARALHLKARRVTAGAKRFTFPIPMTMACDWITGTTEPKPHRYHAGLNAGQLSQAAIITTMLLRSVVEKNGYNEADFCRRLDEELFPQLDGKPIGGPGGYPSQSIREAWRRR